MVIPQSPNQNHLLAALPTAEFERIAPHLELSAMPLGEVLYESSGQLQHAYFPTTAIVSMHYVMESGASSEIAGWAMRAYSAFRFSWAGIPRPAGPSCRPGATATG